MILNQKSSFKNSTIFLYKSHRGLCEHNDIYSPTCYVSLALQRRAYCPSLYNITICNTTPNNNCLSHLCFSDVDHVNWARADFRAEPDAWPWSGRAVVLTRRVSPSYGGNVLGRLISIFRRATHILSPSPLQANYRRHV